MQKSVLVKAVSPENADYPTIPRANLRVLYDGTFVVYWGGHEVQELESGRYRIVDELVTSEAATDYELNQLVDAGLVYRYDEFAVRLCAMPSRDTGPSLAAWEQARVRSYYLNTTLPGVQLADVVALLDELGLSAQYSARVREGFVVLWRVNGQAFAGFDEADAARHVLNGHCAEAFVNTVVAFIETTRRS